MKKIFFCVLCAVLICASCSCGSDTKTVPSVTEAPIVTEEPAQAPTEVPEPEGDPQETEVPSQAENTGLAESGASADASAYKVLVDKLTTDIPLGLQESERVDFSYFNDSLFVGDSVSGKLATYVMKQRRTDPGFMGTAQFFVADSFSCRNALKQVTDTSKHPTYKGKKMTIEDAVAASGSKKVFIMLGMNDAAFGIDKAVDNMVTVIERIRDKNPETTIFIQSATPRIRGSQPTTKELFKYDLLLYETVKDMDHVYFVDVAHAMRDEDGNLREMLCSDLTTMTLHLNDKGCQVWVEWLVRHALTEDRG
ncbi:MAG: hypothetical protein J5859_04390 [Clostridia bacterium]|nr:hypothetical protein [Clostridia bacterium]